MAEVKPPSPDGPGQGGDRGGPRPTVIAMPDRPGRQSAVKLPARPTVIDIAAPAAKPARIPPPDPPAPERKSFAPTAMVGVTSPRIAVTPADLQALSPGVRPEVAEAALRLVQAFAPANLTDRKVVMWGHPLQQDYSDLVSRTLDLSQSDILRNVTAHVGRMIEILGAIDIEAVCGAAPASGVFGQYLKSVNSRIDTPAELLRARDELGQLIHLMNAAFGDLIGFKEVVEQHARQIDALGDAAEAAALAALFLSKHFSRTEPAQAQRFTERSMSLTQTVAQIRSGGAMRSAQIEQPLALIATIQNVALVMVPGWLGSIAALTTMLDTNRQPTPTEARELAFQLRDILLKLKS